ncbi:MAG: MATE family efflux transporter [Planctomycetota bacterium]
MLPKTIRNGMDKWWRGTCGGREVMIVALPLVASLLSWTIMNFVDRMFLLWHSQEAMAAAMPAGMVVFTLICFPMGIAGYANTFVAQYDGSGQHSQIGKIVWQAFFIGIAATPLYLLTVYVAPSLFQMAGHPPTIQAHEVTYYRAMIPGAGGMVCAVGLSTFFSGRGKTNTVMFVDSAAALLNVVLDYAWIFGKFGFAEFGISGAGYATSTCQWTRVAIYLFLLLRHADVNDGFGIRAGRTVSWSLLKRLFRFGGPEGLRMFVEVGAFSVFLMLIGALGKLEMTASTLAFNINSVAFVPLLGLGTAVSTLVGQQLGKNQPQMAKRATLNSLTFAVLYTAVTGGFYTLLPDLMLIGHAAGSDPVEFAEVRSLTIVLLRYVAVYCLFDACVVVFSSALKGAGDTRFVLMTTLIFSPCFIAAAWLGRTILGWRIHGCWLVLTGWICILGIIYAVRYRSGQWESMRVIEMDAQHEQPEMILADY